MVSSDKLLRLKPIQINVEGPTIIGVENNIEFRMYKIDWIKTPMVFRYIDEWLIKPIFAVREYAIPLKDFEPKFILDCGGNIGTSAVFFANYYPTAKIVAVEPDAGNFQLLSINTRFYPNVECVNAALWDQETYIELKGWHPSSYKAFETDANLAVRGRCSVRFWSINFSSRRAARI
ncbi:MAG: FkbM family methyltransferase [Selenomonadaceae bacterium]|nr:FkbM family methyltransferase [Selenomonadaceae bacterium]